MVQLTISKLTGAERDTKQWAAVKTTDGRMSVPPQWSSYGPPRLDILIATFYGFEWFITQLLEANRLKHQNVTHHSLKFSRPCFFATYNKWSSSCWVFFWKHILVDVNFFGAGERETNQKCMKVKE